MSAGTQAEITETWRDRLVEVVKMRAGDILPHPHNPKVHPPAQTEPLKGLLSEVGKCDILKAYRSERMNGALVYWDGHAREGLNLDEHWQVGIYDLTDREADLLIAAFDPLANLAQQDREQLDKLLHEVDTSNTAVMEMLAGLARENQLYETGGDSVGDVWRGMPEYHQEDQKPFQTIAVHFECKSDLERFAQLINQTVTEKTKWLWFPYRERASLMDNALVEDEP